MLYEVQTVNSSSNAGRFTYTEPEFAQRVGISVALVRQLRRQGRLSHIRVNKRVLYTDKDIQSFFASHRSSAREEGE